MHTDFAACREMLRNSSIMLYFRGPVTQEVVEGLGSMVRRKVDQDAPDRNQSTLAFSILVEQLQNVLHYAADATPTETGRMATGELIIRREPGGLCISCGNLIQDQTAGHLRRLLDSLGGLSREELRQRYKAARRQPPPPPSRGAGLGLLEMARRAAKPLGYDITPLPGSLAWFSLDVVID